MPSKAVSVVQLDARTHTGMQNGTRFNPWAITYELIV